ncbi:ATP-binding protein [Kitasatospora terrestris]|uniref:Histidine kinase/HSP90-like ATPase domain-containing protein n=1 Tax=Kitasatospora terrestris TaxID=258051 RepID=A0ABP9D7R2_9ACTN
MRRPLAPAFHHRLPSPPRGDAAHVRRGLAFTRTALALRRPDADRAAVDDLLLVVAELLANADRHAGGPLALDLCFEPDGHGVRIEVDDPAPDPPRPRSSPAHEPHGHGLRVVDRLASAWGSTPTGSGKTVWAELPLPQAPHPTNAQALTDTDRT